MVVGYNRIMKGYRLHASESDLNSSIINQPQLRMQSKSDMTVVTESEPRHGVLPTLATKSESRVNV